MRLELNLKDIDFLPPASLGGHSPLVFRIPLYDKDGPIPARFAEVNRLRETIAAGWMFPELVDHPDRVAVRVLVDGPGCPTDPKEPPEPSKNPVANHYVEFCITCEATWSVQAKRLVIEIPAKVVHWRTSYWKDFTHDGLIRAKTSDAPTTIEIHAVYAATRLPAEFERREPGYENVEPILLPAAGASL